MPAREWENKRGNKIRWDTTEPTMHRIRLSWMMSETLMGIEMNETREVSEGILPTLAEVWVARRENKKKTKTRRKVTHACGYVVDRMHEQ